MDQSKTLKRGSSNSPRIAAAVAAFGLLAMSVLAPLIIFGVFPGLFGQGGGQAFLDAKLQSPHLIWSIVGLVAVVILDVVVAWALFRVFKARDFGLSLISALLRTAYAAGFLFAILSLADIFPLLPVTAESHRDILLFYQSFKTKWDLALIVFGIHLLFVAVLVFRSRDFPKFLGLLVALSGLGYLLDGLGKQLIPGYDISLSAFTFIGEILLMVWLFVLWIKGFNKTKVMGPLGKIST